MIHPQAPPDLLSFLIDRVNVGILVLDKACHVVVFNHFLEAHSGRRSAEVLGLNVFDAFPELPRAWLTRKIGNVVLLKNPAFTSWQQRPYLFRFAHHRRITSSLDYMRQDCTFIPVVDALGEVSHVCIVVNDVTDTSIAHTELERAKREAESANQAKSDFLATMSHEIRTPLSGVIGMNQFLLESDLTAEQRDLAETTGNCASALLSLLNDILDFSKIAAGKMELEQADFDLRATMEESVEVVSAAAHKKGLEVALIFESDVPERVSGDAGRLRQIALNLLNNAVKFTSTGLVSLEVSRDHDFPEERRIRFDVRDTGVGIPADRRDRLFQTFSQVDASTTRKYGGTGLGLAICKKLAELMGGTVGVASEPGVGSSFWFSVPLADPSSSSPRALSADRTDPIRALVVVGSRVTRVTLLSSLEQLGAAAEGVESQADARKRLIDASSRQRPYDLCFMDAETVPQPDVLDAIERTGTRIVTLGYLGRKTTPDPRLGAVVNLNRPVRQAHLRDCVARLGRMRPAAPVRSGIPQRTSGVNGGCVLIAEDNAVNQRIAARLVEKLGYQADVVCNGREAIEALARAGYVAILMDGEMPELDGFEATRMIREREGQGSRVPIVAMTASTMAGDRERCLAAGMDEYVSKPISLERLRDVLHDAIRGAAQVPVVS